jgi:polyhydroxybutyrate depolymerase
MKSIVRLVALSALIFASSNALSQTCGSGGAITDADGNLFRPYQERTINVAGDDRKWLLRLPAGYQQGKKSDVVFNFHGAGSTAEKQFAYADFTELADRDGIILVMPDANKIYVDQSHHLAGYWNGAWEAKWRERDYDIDFVLAVVEELRDEYCVGDFYAAGMSAGGDMTTALQCMADSPFQAFAPVTYRYWNAPECEDAPARPMISFHGSDDKVVPIEGLPAPWFDPHMSEIMQSWATHNGCDPEVAEARVGGDVLRYSWTGCDAPVEWYLVEGGGHTWPGGVDRAVLGHTTHEISATKLIWEFLFRE